MWDHAILVAAATAHGTPLYVYDARIARDRVGRLNGSFGALCEISYAVKANPNRALLGALAAVVQHFDVSSLAEAQRVREVAPSAPMSFTGPGKRDEELLGFARLGGGVIVLESLDEAEVLASLIRRHGLPPQDVLIRVNPRATPRQFGARMSGRGSQFGIDEEDIAPAIRAVRAMPALALLGLHCYSASNGLRTDAIAEHLIAMADMFQGHAAMLADARMLVFGAGFGVGYAEGEEDADVGAVAALVLPRLSALRAAKGFQGARLVLELGRWITAPSGVLLTRVIRSKASRGRRFHICDAGFNAHLAACGLLGGTFRRNWRISNITNPGGDPETCDLVGPLCTTLDHVATEIALPQVRTGDLLAIWQSGAYGLTASPTRFISHPEPHEVLIDDGALRDVTESRANAWINP